MEPAEIFRHNVIRIIEEKKFVQASIAADLNESPQSLNDYLKGRINWGEKKRKKLAGYLKVDYHQLYNQELPAGVVCGIKLGAKFGVEHIRANPTERITASENSCELKEFQNKVLAKAINERLARLEKYDPAALDKVMGYIEGMISVYQSSFLDRRKSDNPEKMPKSGDRRKAVG